VSQLGIGADGCHGAQRVWTDPDGRKARAALDALLAEAPHAAHMAPPAFRAVLDSVLGDEIRNAVIPEKRVMIWGTLEARVQGADLVILGGLNDGTWPELPAPDPWLNRRMRAAAGLLLPERRIGLAAHDFQQAIAAPLVVLSRARRNADAETVPSRWLNRLVNLMKGLTAQNGPEALDAMRNRGQDWVEMAAAMDRPTVTVPAATRPAPRPPVATRPRELPVTDIERLIRDPFDIYAKRILRLRPLDPLHRDPDPRDRGSVLHEVMERFIPDFASLPPEDRVPRLLDTAREGTPDDLTAIKGVGPKLEALLHNLGVYHYDQVAGWTADEVAWVDRNLEGFKGRVSRDNWVEQAKTLAAGGKTEFSDRAKKGDV